MAVEFEDHICRECYTHRVVLDPDGSPIVADEDDIDNEFCSGPDPDYDTREPLTKAQYRLITGYSRGW